MTKIDIDRLQKILGDEYRLTDWQVALILADHSDYANEIRLARNERRRRVYAERKGAGHFLTTEMDWAACGTEANAAAHRRRGEDPCGPCRQAESRARQDRAAATRVPQAHG